MLYKFVDKPAKESPVQMKATDHELFYSNDTHFTLNTYRRFFLSILKTRSINVTSVGFNDQTVLEPNFCFFYCFQVYPTPPYVFVTAVHKQDVENPKSENKHDAAIVWAEDVTHENFKACVRELKNFDGIHRNVEVVSKIKSSLKTAKQIETKKQTKIGKTCD